MSVGTAHYAKIADADLSAVPGDVDRIARFFVDALGYKQVLTEIARDPRTHELRSALSEVFSSAGSDDKIAFYYTGHGETKGGRFYLLTTDSELDRLSGTAFAVEDLMHVMLESRLNQALLILDTCYSGKGISILTEIASRYESAHRWDRHQDSGFHFIASAWSKEEATQGAFATAFVETIANRQFQLGGRTQQYLQPAAIVSAINRRPGHEWHQHAVYASFNLSVDSCLIPNPRYNADAPVGLDIETLRRRDLAEHFLPRARGADLSSDVWYFTGRESARRQLVRWLTSSDSGGRPCIVTGSPGTGKSALLGWLVALSDPQTRLAMARAVGDVALDPVMTPPADSVDLALHARGMDAADVVRAIGARVGVDVDGPAALVDVLTQREERFALVVDALDEASDTRGITKLLRELAPLPHFWISVGTRPDQYNENAERRYTALGPRTIEIDLDDPRYLGSDDIARYVERRLLAYDEPWRHTPYRGNLGQAKSGAAAVARRAGTVFLIAYILSRNLMAADSPLDVTGQKWQDATAIDEAFDEDLERFNDLPLSTGLNKRTACDLLRPLAFAEGAGLPWDAFWATLATAIAGKSYTDSDIDTLLDHAGAYIIEALEHGCSVYRLYHQELADYFRRDKSREREIQRRIVDALERSIPRDPRGGGPNWRSAHSYIVAHYAAHAVDAKKTAICVMHYTSC